MTVPDTYNVTREHWARHELRNTLNAAAVQASTILLEHGSRYARLNKLMMEMFKQVAEELDRLRDEQNITQ